MPFIVSKDLALLFSNVTFSAGNEMHCKSDKNEVFHVNIIYKPFVYPNLKSTSSQYGYYEGPMPGIVNSLVEGQNFNFKSVILKLFLNPASEMVIVVFSLENKSKVQVDIFSIDGTHINSIIDWVQFQEEVFEIIIPVVDL